MPISLFEAVAFLLAFAMLAIALFYEPKKKHTR